MKTGLDVKRHAARRAAATRLVRAVRLFCAIGGLGLAFLPSSQSPARAAAAKPVKLVIINHSGSSIACQALTARWYSFDLGSHRDGSEFPVAMVVDSKTGTLSMLNQHKTPMPIRLFYCGVAGREWETRYELGVLDLVGMAKDRRQLAATCVIAGAGDSLTCRVSKGH